MFRLHAILNLGKSRTSQASAVGPRSFFRGFVLILLPFLSAACHQGTKPEDIALPYAKKKYETRLWVHPDLDSSDANHGLPVVPSAFSALLDSTLQVQAPKSFLGPFLWVEGFSFDEERRLWKDKQYQVTRQYLSCLSYRKGGKLSPFLKFKDFTLQAERPLLHTAITENNLPIHLFYRASSFEDGQNPVVLMPYCKEIGRYLPPPVDFFETGGILAVLGERSFVTIRDSSRYFVKTDSLARLIWLDTARSSFHLRNYRAFKKDSVATAACIKVSRKEQLPTISSQDLIQAANRLIADMYTTPAKIALLSVENEHLAAECAVLDRKDLFTAAVFDIKDDSSVREIYRRLGPGFLDSPRPAILTNAAQWVLAACLQDTDLRKTGSHPFLVADIFTMEDAWRFLLYHIAKEERLVEAE